MGWTISHGNTSMPGGAIVRPYGVVADLGQHLAHALPAREWRKISYLFNRGSGDPFVVTPRDAALAAEALRAGAKARRVPRDFRRIAKDIGDAADRAARGGETWHWR